MIFLSVNFSNILFLVAKCLIVYLSVEKDIISKTGDLQNYIYKKIKIVN